MSKQCGKKFLLWPAGPLDPFFFSLIAAFFYLFQFGVDVERHRVDVRGLGNNKKHRWQVMLASCALRQSQQRPAEFPVRPVKQEQRLAHVP